MLKDLKVEGEARELIGRKISRKLARQGKIPGILYGGTDAPIMFQIDPRRINAVLHSESGSNTLFHFSLSGREEKAVTMIKAVQNDPLTGRLVHADLLRISMDKPIEVRVPIHLVGSPRGVKQQGGILDFVLREIMVSCLPGDIPERFDADVSELDLGSAVKVSDLKIPAKVKILTDLGKAVATVVAPAAEKSAEAAAAEATETPAEPEVIKKGKAESAEEGAEGEPAKGAAAKGGDKTAAKGAEKSPAGKEKSDKGGKK